METSRFHQGELAVQRRAGVVREAERLSGMLAPPNLDGGVGKFLAGRDFAVLTGRDRTGRLWTSPLHGHIGFLDASGTSVTVNARLAPGDPLTDMAAGGDVGLIAIEFQTRRRVRVNGSLTSTDPDRFTIDVDQAFGNCPKYISQRELDELSADSVSESHGAQRTTELEAAHVSLIENADTFFLGTTHPDSGIDSSHRGGTPGFVRVENGELWWPDYPGNNMFNSFGNLAVDASSSLLFLDFATGATLHLSGTAVLEWVEPGSAGDDGGTGRRVRFTPELIVADHRAHITASNTVLYRFNPPVAS